MKTHRRFCIAFLGFGLPFAVWNSGCSRSEPAAREPVRPVKTLVVAAGDENQERTFPGKVEAAKKAELAFQVSGLLTQLPVREGQEVEKGDLIAQLRQDDFQARLETVQGQLDQARATLRALQAGERPEQVLRLEANLRAADARLANAQIEFDRATRLLRANALSRSDYDRAETDYRVAQEEREAARQSLEKGSIAREEDVDAQEAVVRGLEAQVVEANLQLEDSTLTAPFKGVVAQRFVEANQNVQAKQPIVQFQDANEIDVAVDVPESLMATLRRADIVQIVAEFTGVPGLQFPLELREIGQTADPTTQTFLVRGAMLSPPDINLLPGMTARVTLTYRRALVLGDRILVPISAVFKDDEGRQIVWIVKDDNTVTALPVTLGEAAGSQIEIVSGLEPGVRIAAAGASILREGMTVRDLADDLGGGVQP